MRIADHIGRVLGGRYRLSAVIGTGASAHVFLADDSRLGRRVAVKILHPALADDAAFLRRFRAEARAAAALSHPNVLAVYDWGEERDGPFIVTEFLGGGSLRAMLDRGLRLTPSQALLVGLEAARGLDYAHRRGLVHRDVKPANILFDEDGRLRIADFGLARALAEAAWTEPSGAVLGTARYAAPEQVRGTPLDGKADVYSLAVVLVEAVTGRVPFAADTTVGTIMGRLERPLDVPPDVGALAPILLRAGQQHAADRPDAMAFGSALHALAPTLPAPDPLPLAGPAIFDEMEIVDRDPTDMGILAAPPAPGVPAGGPGAALTGAMPGAAGAFATANPGASPVAGPVVPPGASTGPTSTPPTVTTAPAGSADPTVADRPLLNGAGGGTVAFVEAAPIELSKAGRRRRRWPRVALAAVVVLVCAAVGAFAYVNVRTPTHLLPAVLDARVEIAKTRLERLGYHVRTTPAFNDQKPKGTVIDQRPVGNVRLAEGKYVTLTVSDGATPVGVPDLTNLGKSDAQAALDKAMLTLAEGTPEFSEDVDSGVVLRWDPKGQARHGDTVTVVFSKGPQPRTIPDLTKMTYDQAVAALQAKDLSPVPDSRNDDNVPEGAIIGTRPPVGTAVDKGSQVTIVVSKGQPVVPNLNGMNQAQAKAALEAVGLKLGNVFGLGGTVFRSTPDAGTKQKSGTSVSIFIL